MTVESQQVSFLSSLIDHLYDPELSQYATNFANKEATILSENCHLLTPTQIQTLVSAPLAHIKKTGSGNMRPKETVLVLSQVTLIRKAYVLLVLV